MTLAERILAWCRLHDWGQSASLGTDAAGEPVIRGLLETERQPSGEFITREVTLPARLSVIGAWAGY